MKQYTDSELMLWRPAKNVGSAVINPREIVRVCTGGDSLNRSIVAVTQPDSTVGKTYAVNGPVPIQANDFGRVCFGPVVLVAYDTGTPAVDDQYGWVSGQGTVSASSSNLIINNLRVVDPTNKLLLGSMLAPSSGPQPYQLTAVLDPAAIGGTVTAKLVAPGDFYGSGPTVTLYDPFRNSWGVTGDIVWAQTSGGSYAGQLGIVKAGSLNYPCTLNEKLNYRATAAATVVSDLSLQNNTVITVTDVLLKYGDYLPAGTFILVVPCIALRIWMPVNTSCS